MSDRVEVDVVDPLAQLAEDAVAAVEQDVGLARLDQIAAAGAPGVLPRRRLAEHRDSQAGSLITAPRATLAARTCGASG